MNKATFIKNCDGFTGVAKLYKLSPPLADEPWDEDDEPTLSEYVLVSGVNAMFTGPETFIFPADENGSVTSCGELPGSFRGSIDHEQALANAGYQVSA